MCLAPMHFFVGPALGAELAFDFFDEPEKQAALFPAGMLARWTSQAAFRQLAVPIGNGFIHASSRLVLSTTAALVKSHPVNISCRLDIITPYFFSPASRRPAQVKNGETPSLSHAHELYPY